MSRAGTTVLWSVVMAVPLLHAQEFRASLGGRVLDAGGSAIPGAKVRAINDANGEYRESVSDAEGNYHQLPVPVHNPATYTVGLEVQGFKTGVKTDLRLSVNQSATLDLKLELEAITTQVTAEAPLLEDANGDCGGPIDGEREGIPAQRPEPVHAGDASAGREFRRRTDLPASVP